MLHLAVIACAFLISIFGVGGGVFYVPLLVSFGLPFHEASATSLLIIAVTGLSAFMVFRREGLVDWRLALMLDPLKDAGAFLGGFYSALFSEGFLSILFAAVLLGGGVLMMRQREEDSLEDLAPERGWKRQVGGEAYAVNLLVVLPFSLAAGFFSGLLGIGGGVFMVPLMTLAAGVPMKVAVATSSLMVFMTGTFGFAGGALAGHFRPLLGLSLAAAAYVGAQIGPRVTVRLDKHLLRKAFVGLMYLVALLMLYRGFTSLRPPGSP
jgi:hypothetical protein